MHLRLARLPAFLAPALVLCATGCSASSAPITAALEAPRAVEAPVRGARTLVWTTNEDGERMTWTVDEAGNVLELSDGVRVVARGGIWDWRESPEAVATTACPSYDENGNEQPATAPSQPGTGVRVTLEREGNADKSVLITPASQEGAQELQQDVELEGSVGPYLFIRESTYVYACGAHGNVGVSFRVHDVEHGTDVWSSGDAGPFLDGRATARERTRAQADLVADEDVAMFVTDGKLDVDLTAVLPSFDADAVLAVDLQFTAFTCYACSDGVWSSYTKSTTRPLDAIPVSLRPWATPPAGVAAFLRAYPLLTVRGWSRLPGA
jgi:hypothetical protein